MRALIIFSNLSAFFVQSWFGGQFRCGRRVLFRERLVLASSGDGGGEAGGWSQLNVAELKAELRARGIRVSGRKAELVARLEADDAAASRPGSNSQYTEVFEDVQVVGAEEETESGVADESAESADSTDPKSRTQEEGDFEAEAAYAQAKGINDGLRREQVSERFFEILITSRADQPPYFPPPLSLHFLCIFTESATPLTLPPSRISVLCSLVPLLSPASAMTGHALLWEVAGGGGENARAPGVNRGRDRRPGDRGQGPGRV